jgi:adenosylmethionine-8-amino-7-oxononanoate aminotransferase
VNVAELQKSFVKQGVWIRPFGKLVYIMPPYIINPQQLSQLTKAIYNVLK